MKFISLLPLAILFIFIGCNPSQQNSSEKKSLHSLLPALHAIEGKAEFLDAPYVTAGNRVYMIGNQDGTFPDIGWHVKGEMGGIWDHPIKLMDGIAVYIHDAETGRAYCLDDANSFTNYSIANRHQYDVEELELTVSRLQYVPDDEEAIVFEFQLDNQSTTKVQNITFNLTALVDLRQVWLGERTNMVDYKDEVEFNGDIDAFVAKDSGNEWYAVFGTDLANTKRASDNDFCKVKRLGKGIDASLSTSLQIKPTETQHFRFFVAGSAQSKQQAMASYQLAKTSWLNKFEKKRQKYQAIQSASNLNIPDKDIEELYTWTKFGTEWLVREVPEFGTGISAGLPDYPWWFGADLAYTVQGLLPIGQHELAIKAIDQIFAFSEQENGNGRIVHEVSTNGVVFNPGNVNETPIMIATCWEVYEWTGDRGFLERSYAMAKKGISWLESVDEDNNGYPDGHGMMEIHGMDSEMIDVVAYTQQAYGAASKMAMELGDTDNARLFQQKADRLKEKINSDWWVQEEASFADFRAERVKASKLLEDAIIRADTLDKPWAVADLKALQKTMSSKPAGKSGYAFYHNWVVNTPLEINVANADLALQALQTGRKFTNKFGMYVTGLDRDENFDASFAASKKKEDFNYVGAVMTLPTGVQAIAEANYGNMDQALQYLHMLHNSFSYATPGTMYEVSPDYGMLVQAWNIYGIAKPIIVHYFGIKPQAYNKLVKLTPNLPTDWPSAAIEQVKVGANSLDFSIEHSTEQSKYSITQSQEGWTIQLAIPFSSDKRVFLNGQEIEPDVDGENWIVTMSSLQNEVLVR